MYQKKLKALDELDAFGCVFAIMAFDELNWAFVLDPQLGAIANRDRCRADDGVFRGRRSVVEGEGEKGRKNQPRKLTVMYGCLI